MAPSEFPIRRVCTARCYLRRQKSRRDTACMERLVAWCRHRVQTHMYMHFGCWLQETLLFCSLDRPGTRRYFWFRRRIPWHTTCIRLAAIHLSNHCGGRRSHGTRSHQSCRHATLVRILVGIDSRRMCENLPRKLRREDRTQALWRPRDSSGLLDKRCKTPLTRFSCGSCGKCPRRRAGTRRCESQAARGAEIRDRKRNPARFCCRTARVCLSSVDTTGMITGLKSLGTCPGDRLCRDA